LVENGWEPKKSLDLHKRLSPASAVGEPDSFHLLNSAISTENAGQVATKG